MRASKWMGVGVAAVVLLPITVGAESSGGRVAIDAPRRVIDTRAGGGPVTEIAIGSGVLNVILVDPAGDGTAVVHPCSEPAPANEATFTLRGDAQGNFWGTIVTGESSCLTSTTPVHVIVDEWGSVSPVPEPDRLQYVALGEPVVLRDGTLPIGGNETVTIARPGELSGSADAVVLSLDVLASSGPGYLTAHACDQPRPIAANINYSPMFGRRANIAIIDLGATADLCIYSGVGTANVRVLALGELRSDGPNPAALPPSWTYVAGEVPPPSLHPISPVRVLDTRAGVGRDGTAKVEPHEVVEIDFGSRVGPSTTAVVLNVTVTEPDAAGHLTVYPCGGEPPLASNLNFVAAETVPNLAVSRLGPSRTVCITGPARTHIVADLNATLETDGGFRAQPVEPARVLDTRTGTGRVASGKLSAGETVVFQVAGEHEVPATAGAVTLNVTATEPDAAGFVTVYPCDAERPQASNLNYTVGQTIPNLVTARLAADGTVCLYTKSATHLVADLAAWYSVDSSVGIVDLAPQRLLDTRNGTGAPTAKLDAGGVLHVQVAGRGGVPEGAGAAVLNLTVVAPEANGFVTAWPCDRSMPTVSNLNYLAGETNPNLATVKLSSTGTVCLYSKAAAHLVADVTGYLSDALVDGQLLTLQAAG